MYNPEFEDLKQKYKRPFFFTAQKSYKDIEFLQIGDQMIYFKGQQEDEGGKFVNNLFDEQIPANSTKVNRGQAAKPKQEAAFSIREKIKSKRKE